MIKPGDRVMNLKQTDWLGTVLRLETYPGTGTFRWATVKWDWSMGARRADPAQLVKVT